VWITTSRTECREVLVGWSFVGSGLKRVDGSVAGECRSALSCRLPPRLRRKRVRLPVQTGIGAVPVCIANAAAERNRETPAVSAMICAAVKPG
jgi:hypothetical protein